MEGVKRRRGRPRKVVEESPVVTDSLAVEENTAQAKLRQAKEDKKAREGLKYTTEKYYYLQPFMNNKNQPDHKVILVRRKTNGTCYRTYVCRASKEPGFVEDLKSKGLLRDK